MKKRALCITLIVSMMLLIIPLSAHAESEITTWEQLQAAIDGAPAAGVVTLTQDLSGDSTASPITVTSKRVTLDLGGYTLSRNLTEAQADGNVITVKDGGQLIIQNGTVSSGKTTSNGGNILVTGDSTTGIMTQNLTITGGFATSGGGIASEGATFAIISKDTKITNNSATNGGGIYVATTTNLAISASGLEISNNTATDGAGIYLSEGSSIGTGIAKFDNNIATNNGGAIYAGGYADLNNAKSLTISNCSAKNGGAAYITSNGRVEVSSATIEKCAASNNGGAFYIEAYGNNGLTGVLTLGKDYSGTPATISNCTATNLGGAVYAIGNVGMGTATISGCEAATGGGIYLSSSSKLFAGEKAIVSNNTNGSATNNVYLSNGATISIGTDIDVPKPVSGMSIGVTMATPGTFTFNTAYNYRDYFTSDDADYGVFYVNSDNKLTLIENPSNYATVSFVSNNGTDVLYQTVTVGDKATEPGALTKEGYTFSGWFDGDDNLFDFNTTITEDITLTAKWGYVVTFDSNGGSKVDAQKVPSGETATEPTAPAKEGYKLIDWLDQDGNPFDFSTAITEDITLTAKWDVAIVDYEIIKNANSTWELKDGVAPTFSSDADFSKFVRVDLDGKTLDPANYTVESGSTVVTLKPAYAATLSVGKHTLSIVSTDGTATTDFTITAPAAPENEDIADTGDHTAAPTFMALSAIAAVAFYTTKKRDLKNN